MSSAGSSSKRLAMRTSFVLAVAVMSSVLPVRAGRAYSRWLLKMNTLFRKGLLESLSSHSSLIKYLPNQGSRFAF